MTKARIYKLGRIWWVSGPNLIGAAVSWEGAMLCLKRHLDRWSAEA